MAVKPNGDPLSLRARAASTAADAETGQIRRQDETLLAEGTLGRVATELIDGEGTGPEHDQPGMGGMGGDEVAGLIDETRIACSPVIRGGRIAMGLPRKRAGSHGLYGA